MSRSRRRATIPLILIASGIVALIGCIPIPATRQYQPDGTPRPEHVIGKSADSPVRVGYTRIDDAFIAISRQVTARWSGWAMRVTNSGMWTIQNWSVSPDGRQFSVYYMVRTGWLINPLCFSVIPGAEQRWLTLDVDDRGVVTAVNTTSRPPDFWKPDPQRWLEVFDEPTRRKLQAADVLPLDWQLELASRSQQKNRVVTQPTTR